MDAVGGLRSAGFDADGTAIDPNFTLAHFHASSPTDNPTCLAQRARIAETCARQRYRKRDWRAGIIFRDGSAGPRTNS